MPSSDADDAAADERIRKATSDFENALLQLSKVGMDVSDFNLALHCGWIVDGRCGGLVLGVTHERAGVRCVARIGERFYSIQTIEEGEYVVAARPFAKHRDRLIQINAAADGGHAPKYTASDIRLIDARAKPLCRLLWIDEEQFAVNRTSTAVYWKEIDHLNLDENPYLSFWGYELADLSSLRPKS